MTRTKTAATITVQRLTNGSLYTLGSRGQVTRHESLSLAIALGLSHGHSSVNVKGASLAEVSAALDPAKATAVEMPEVTSRGHRHPAWVKVLPQG